MCDILYQELCGLSGDTNVFHGCNIEITATKATVHAKILAVLNFLVAFSSDSLFCLPLSILNRSYSFQGTMW